jgi:hypothetical protein
VAAKLCFSSDMRNRLKTLAKVYLVNGEEESDKDTRRGQKPAESRQGARADRRHSSLFIVKRLHQGAAAVARPEYVSML